MVGIIISYPTSHSPYKGFKSLSVLNSPSNSLVDLDNFKSLVKLVRELCICKVAFKKDLKATLALALHAVVKADHMMHFEAEYRALSNG